MKYYLILITFLFGCSFLYAEEYSELTVDFPKVATYSEATGYGYDLNTSWDGRATTPFFFSVKVPDGNYRVTVTIGSKRRAAVTTIRCESRRLFVENLATKKGELVTRTFVVNKRDSLFTDDKGKVAKVKLKPGEEGKLHWDNKLTIEVNGDAPAIQRIEIERDEQISTLYLLGNSTVVDQSNEPWASWGQMIPRFLNEGLAVANYAESGLAVATLLSQNRWAKVHSILCEGDFVILEFGHNDQKTDDRPGNGAYYAFSHQVKLILDQCNAKGATLILCTPTMRRSFKDGVNQNTHKDYPEAIRAIAEREGLLCIDLQAMTGKFYEAMGEEGSKRAFVHYPAGTWPDQEKALADNTHFNPYGAYEIARMVASELAQSEMSIGAFVLPEFCQFDPSRPDAFETFHWCPCPFIDMTKPDGN